MEVFDLAAWAGSQTTAIGCLVGDTMDHGNTMLRLLLRVLIEPGASRLHDVRAPINISRVVEGSRKEQSGSFHDLLRPDGKTFARPGQRHVAVVSHHTLQPVFRSKSRTAHTSEEYVGAAVLEAELRIGKCSCGLRGDAWVRSETSEALNTSKSSVQRPPSN